MKVSTLCVLFLVFLFLAAWGIGMPKSRTVVRTELLRTGPKVRSNVHIFPEPNHKFSSRFSQLGEVRTKFEPTPSGEKLSAFLTEFLLLDAAGMTQKKTTQRTPYRLYPSLGLHQFKTGFSAVFYNYKSVTLLAYPFALKRAQSR